MALMAAALAVGWPLVHAAVAAGAEDALDALSRSFGYLNQRIGSFVALAGFAWLEGMIGIVLMDLLASGVLRLTEWGLGLTGPATELAAIFGRAGGPVSPVSTAAHAFWLGVVSLVAHAWALQLLLDGRGAHLPLAATRRRRHPLGRARAARCSPFGIDNRSRRQPGPTKPPLRTQFPNHRPATKSPSKTVPTTGSSDSRSSEKGSSSSRSGRATIARSADLPSLQAAGGCLGPKCPGAEEGGHRQQQSARE